MRVLAIADPHLSGAQPKPMDVFGSGWAGHPGAFFEGWRRVVRDDDLVLIAGDISWAMRFEEARVDLDAIAALPGTKVLLRGNHDYWWPSVTRLRRELPARMHVVQNDAVQIGDVAVGGTRGWLCPGSPGFSDEDLKIYQREVGRLTLSLRSLERLDAAYRVVMLHFPPTNARGEPSGFTAALATARLDAVVFGHVHGDGAVAIPDLRGPLDPPGVPPVEGPLDPPGVQQVQGPRLAFVAADRVGFEPVLLRAPATAEGSDTAC